MKEWMGRLEPLNNTSLRNIIRMTFLCRFRISLYYWYRYFLTFVVSSCFLPIRIIESVKYRRKIKKTKINNDPIFIIGHWRTGTTFLHYLMSLDKKRSFAENLDTYGALFTLSAGKITQKIVKFAIPEKRPMDNIELSGSKPGEEEFALAMLGKYSFYHAFIFPRKINYFSKYLTFKGCSEREINKWKKQYHYFLQKITFKNKGNQLILKNPPNTSRIKQLTELYPNAKFIFLMRNPYEIYSSTVLLFNSLLPIFSLQKWEMQKIEQKILENFILIMDIYEESKKILRENQLIELSYERMLEEPLHELEKIYRKLELDNFQQSRDEFQKYILSQRNFVSNVLDISSGIITLVNSNWEKYIIKYGYKKL